MIYPTESPIDSNLSYETLSAKEIAEIFLGSVIKILQVELYSFFNK